MENINLIETIKIENELFKMLYGKVFHVTDYNNLKSIINDKALLFNKDLKYKSLFGHQKNGYFRLRNCISFFDYRDYESEKFKEHSWKCEPLQLLYKTNKIAIFFLDEKEYSKLILWNEWKTEKLHSQMVVPYIEVGIKEKVNLKSISNIIIFENTSDDINSNGIEKLLKKR
ncbi:hypothetical protein [Arcobacter sp.]|uniref:hypothetical protein n=1 Tax=Arcobacter sp. TaxID=1872629 RepID=UPI003D14328A